ncbi:MAG TPA: fluoride efflux transporter CrcB [Terriglobia bacterium]|nr:fluoride efflux transporter CrcB [Terriglobia bacterium]
MAARYIMVMVGGAIGSLTRYVTGSAVMSRFGGRFPLGTLVINVSGSFLIGVLMTLLTERFQPHPNWRLLLVVGFLGGYTTFSSFEYESFRAVHDGGGWIGLGNLVGGVALGYLGVWAGVVLASKR